jgi:hypothetical protein
MASYAINEHGLLWKNNLIFVPHGKIENAKRYAPRVRELLSQRKRGSSRSGVFPSKRQEQSHVSCFPLAKQFSKARKEAQSLTE